MGSIFFSQIFNMFVRIAVGVVGAVALVTAVAVVAAAFEKENREPL